MTKQKNDTASIDSLLREQSLAHLRSLISVPNFFTPHAHRPRFSQSSYAQQKIQRLDRINENNKWMYIQDILNRF